MNANTNEVQECTRVGVGGELAARDPVDKVGVSKCYWQVYVCAGVMPD